MFLFFRKVFVIKKFIDTISHNTLCPIAITMNENFQSRIDDLIDANVAFVMYYLLSNQVFCILNTKL